MFLLEKRLRDFWHSDLATTLLLAFLIFLLFFRARFAFMPNWNSDDGCYLQILSGWIGMFPAGCYDRPHFYAMGAPLLWLPAALPASLLSYLGPWTMEDWVVPAVSLWSFCLWSIALIFLQKTLASRETLFVLGWRSSPRAALLLILCIPALYYATMRNIFSHSAEIACAMATLYFTQKRSWVPAMVSSALLILTRYNDAPVVLFLGGALLDHGDAKGFLKHRRLILSVLAASCLGFLGLAAFYGFQNYTLLHLIRDLSWESTLNTFLGLDFGLLYTAPWLLGALFLGFLRIPHLSWRGRGALAWVTLELLLVIGWNGNGGEFGYRYLIGCYAAAIALWLEVLELKWPRTPLKRLSTQGVQSAFRILTVFNAVCLTYILITYKTLVHMGPHNPAVGFYNPYFLVKAISAPFYLPKIFFFAPMQQFPLVTLFVSFYKKETITDDAWGVHGPGLLLLFLATSAALVYILLYVLRNRPGRPKA